MIKAVIFDLDNLMIDSEMLHYQAYKEVLLNYNISFNIADYNRYFGVSDKDISSDLVNKFKLSVSEEKILNQKDKIFREKFIHKITPKKGLLNLLKKIYEDNYLLAVASSSQIEEIETILKNLKISHFFKEIISADFVKNGKPAPDVFLLAAENLKVSPINCLVLEDSASGVIAAKKAGMKCYAIPNPVRKNRQFNNADKILDSLDDVYYFLKKEL